MKLYTDVLDLIGETPMLEIKGLSKNKNVKIFAKLEGQNISGSIKDRFAKYIISDAEKSGELTKEKTILEATSGNTGIALAMVAAVKNYKVELVMAENASQERKQLLNSLGAKLIFTPAEKGTGGALEKCHEIFAKNPANYWCPNQHSNSKHIQLHYESTGSEILQQVPAITHFFASCGTGATLLGIGKRLKEFNSKIYVQGVQPLFGEKIDGLRNKKEKNSSKLWNPEISKIDKYVDKISEVTASETQNSLKKFIKETGLLIGPSSGAVLAAVQKFANLLENGNIVIIFPDRLEKYLSRDLFN